MQIYNTICPVVWLNLLYSHGSEQGLLCTHFALLKYKKKKKKGGGGGVAGETPM